MKPINYEDIQKTCDQELANATDLADINDLTKKFLGKKGVIAELFIRIKETPTSEKKADSLQLQALRQDIEAKLARLKEKFSVSQSSDSFFDPTLPGTKIEVGHLHPLTLVQRDLEKIFSSMGFMILGGPELESDYYNFEALNIPKTHPARDMQDTFFIDKKNENNEYDLVMRTQTSPMQIRAMEKYGAPLRAVVIGRTFRNEATDASHEHSFHQIEGLMIGENISLANLKAVLKEMLSSIYQQEIEVRIRPGYFPFVEPGLEIDMSCTFCQGAGCSICKKTGWVEMLGAGLVHPNVLRAGGVDPKKYSGFAFGIGIERLTMLKYGINDIRLFNSGDLHFLKQF